MCAELHGVVVLGNRIGTRTGEGGELLGGLVLIGVGVVVASGIV